MTNRTCWIQFNSTQLNSIQVVCSIVHGIVCVVYVRLMASLVAKKGVERTMKTVYYLLENLFTCRCKRLWIILYRILSITNKKSTAVVFFPLLPTATGSVFFRAFEICIEISLCIRFSSSFLHFLLLCIWIRLSDLPLARKHT